MTPIQFEQAVADKLRTLGWKPELTPATGDYGADIIAICAGERLVVQCKKYGESNSIPFRAVQEVYFARDHYEASIAAIIYPGRRITKQARDAAARRSIVLVRYEELKTGCQLDRSTEGHLHKQRVEKEIRDEERRIRRLERLSYASFTVELNAQWHEYSSILRPFREKKRDWYIKSVISLYFTILALVWLYEQDTWLLLLGGIIAWGAGSLWMMTKPIKPSEPAQPPPTTDEVRAAKDYLAECEGYKSTRALITCLQCATLSRVPAGRKIAIKCPKCGDEFVRDLRAGP